MAKVELKQPIVQAIADDIKDAQSVVIVDYRGLTVAQDTELRKQLREAGVIYKVCKNTMMKELLKVRISQVWKNTWKDRAQWLYLKTMLQLRKNHLQVRQDSRGSGSKSRCSRRNCLRCSRNHRTFQDSFKRRAPLQIAWKLTVTYHKSCSCT